MNNKVVVNKIDVDGAKFTRSDVLAMYLNPIMDNSSGDRTFFDVFKTANLQMEKLTRLGIFTSIDIVFEYPEDDKYLNVDIRDQQSVTPVDIKLVVKERSRVYVKTGTEFDKNEADLNLTGIYRNALGGGEVLSFSASRGTLTKSSFELQAKKPIHQLNESSLEVVAYKNSQDYTTSSSFIQQSIGAAIKWNFKSLYGYHQLSIGESFREMMNVSKDSSFNIYELAKISNKLNIQHTFVRDTRDDLYLLSFGKLLKNVTEFAYLNSASSYFKNETLIQLSRYVSDNLNINLTTKFGFIKTIQANADVPIYDRFFLGGSTDVRGFAYRGIGPKSISKVNQFESIGGNAYWAVGISAFTPVPYLKDWSNLKSHFFLNAGSLYSQLEMKDLATSIKNNPICSSLGLGLLFKTSVCRLEVNLVHPFLRSKMDKEAYSYFQSDRGPKIQVGFGMEFL